MTPTEAPLRLAVEDLDRATVELHRWADDLRDFNRWVALYDDWSPEEVLETVGLFGDVVGAAPAAVAVMDGCHPGSYVRAVTSSLRDAMEAVEDAVLAGVMLPGATGPLPDLAGRIATAYAGLGSSEDLLPGRGSWLTTVQVRNALRMWDRTLEWKITAPEETLFREAVRRWDEDLTGTERRLGLRDPVRVTRKQREQDPVLRQVDRQRYLLHDSVDRLFELTGELDDLLTVLELGWNPEPETRRMLLELAGRQVESEGESSGESSASESTSVQTQENAGVEDLMAEARSLSATWKYPAQTAGIRRAASLIEHARDLSSGSGDEEKFAEMLRGMVGDEDVSWYLAAVLGQRGIGPCAHGLEDGYRPAPRPWELSL